MGDSVEHISIDPKNDINTAFLKREQKAFQEINREDILLQEGIPKMDALCERHQTAFMMFCESEKGFSPFLKAHNLG